MNIRGYQLAYNVSDSCQCRVKKEKPTRCNWFDVYYGTSISTCFGCHYAHHQENKSVHSCVWYSALVVLAVVVWSWDASCVHCESYCLTRVEQ